MHRIRHPSAPAEPRGPDPGVLARAIDAAGRTLAAIYALDLELEAARFVIPPEEARGMLPEGSPPSGVVLVEEEGTLWLGLYLDPEHAADAGAVIEETSHLVCLAWHASQARPVSQLALELQGEVDQYVMARLEERDAFAHFERFAWADWMDEPTRARYARAHGAARRYCRGLTRRFPRRVDTPGLLCELRRFYRASPQAKLRAAGG